MQCFRDTYPAEFLLVLWNLTDVPPKVLDRELVCEGGGRGIQRGIQQKCYVNICNHRD